MPIWGFTQSSSPIPTARSIPRAAVFSRPSVTSRLLGLISGVCGVAVMFGILEPNYSNSLLAPRSATPAPLTLLERSAFFGALEHEFAHASGIGLAARSLHNRTHDRASGLDLALANLADHVGLLGERRVHSREQRGIVRNYLEAAGGNDLGRRTLAGQYPGQNLTSEFIVQLAVLNQFLQFGNLLGSNVQIGERLVFVTRDARELAHPPLTGRGGRRAHCNGGFNDIDCVGIDHVAHFQVTKAPLLLQASAPQRRQFGKGGAQFFDPLFARSDRNEIGVRKIAVLFSGFLETTGGRDAGVFVPVTGFLAYFSPAIKDGSLA